MKQKEIVKFDNLELEELSTEQELMELNGGIGAIGSLSWLLSGLNVYNCRCNTANNCSCKKTK